MLPTLGLKHQQIFCQQDAGGAGAIHPKLWSWCLDSEGMSLVMCWSFVHGCYCLHMLNFSIVSNGHHPTQKQNRLDSGHASTQLVRLVCGSDIMTVSPIGIFKKKVRFMEKSSKNHQTLAQTLTWRASLGGPCLLPHRVPRRASLSALGRLSWQRRSGDQGEKGNAKWFGLKIAITT